MCYAIPGKITGFQGKKVIIDYFGEKRYAHNDFVKVKSGDYIYAQGGFVINVVPEKEAREILEFWKETFFKLRKVDLRLSKLEGKSDASKKTRIILDAALEGRKIKFEEYLHLFSLEDEGDKEYLYKVANFIRQKYHKNACCVHGIIEFSNYCANNCLYCGIRKDNISLPRYRMTEKEILETVKLSIDTYGFKALVLQSGEDPEWDAGRIAKLIKKIRGENDVLIFISVGEVGKAGLKKFYDAGARGVLIRFETSNENIYSKIHPGDSLERRMKEIEEAKKMGFLVLTGGLVGFPGQTDEDTVKDILAAVKLGPEMYTFGPFIPHPQTPFAGTLSPPLDKILKTIALLRIADPMGKIVSTTALETLAPVEGRNRGFMAGANSMMLNLTPDKYRKN
ncbi:MAG: [FeFe] hydrogenase H-cluster radical SAM maturase HydE, partial [Candidatus Omnitrophica bacterium]|nr:[FeFe] hydrogenase H-cluster radical SAM maturase HydE [Candidatus Omnitrophota bacterium]